MRRVGFHAEGTSNHPFYPRMSRSPWPRPHLAKKTRDVTGFSHALPFGSANPIPTWVTNQDLPFAPRAKNSRSGRGSSCAPFPRLELGLALCRTLLRLSRRSARDGDESVARTCCRKNGLGQKHQRFTQRHGQFRLPVQLRRWAHITSGHKFGCNLNCWTDRF